METVLNKENTTTEFTKKRKAGCSLNVYSYNNKWCEDCHASYEGGCTDHPLTSIPDKKTLPLAFSTLPEHLVISEISQKTSQASVTKPQNCNHGIAATESALQLNCRKVVRFVQDGSEGKNFDYHQDRVQENLQQERINFTAQGIFAKQNIPSRTQFGPLVCRFTGESEAVNPQPFPLLLDRANGTISLSDLSDPETCNWMMFVRPASASSNQNLVAFQHDQSIFYVSTENIEAGQELRVWYAAPYAQRLGVALLKEPTGLESGCCETDAPCKPAAPESSSEEGTTSPEQNLESRRRSKEVNFFTGRIDNVIYNEDIDSTRLELLEEIVSEKEHDNGEDNNNNNDDDDCDYNPKKETKSYWPRKPKKRPSEKRPPGRPGRGSRPAGARWSCQQCNLTFSDPSVLNLHTLVHAAEDVTFAAGGGGRVRGATSAPISGPSAAETSEPRRTDGRIDLDDLMTLTCPVCNEDFQTRSSLVAHVGQHGSTRQSLVQSKPFKCQLCCKTFGLFERLQRHLVCHGDESLKPIPCEVCKRRFMNPAALAVHMKTHGDRKYYTCPLCPESFDQVRKLRSHAEERHMERTIKSFNPMAEEGGSDAGVRFYAKKTADFNLEITATGHSGASTFGADATCAAVAMATATDAITSEMWMDACREDPSLASDCTTEGDLRSYDDAGGDGSGGGFFREEDVSPAAPRKMDSEDTEKKSPVVGKKVSKGATVPGATEGTYHCPECHRVFSEFSAISRHVRLFHTSRSFECKDCGRKFPRRDKLRLHALRHSNHREFVCETCGRQFKRKDKLRDHLRRQHDPAKRNEVPDSLTKKKDSHLAFKPEISPQDFTRFTFKCQKCLIGFKRRGMLVNHMAKKHPDVSVDSVPELNLPILTSRHDFFCQYCNKVFKSSSKRKFHILKHHPGSELPASLRAKKRQSEVAASKGTGGTEESEANPSFSAPSGHLASRPHSCDMCHKQYTSKSKLFQHKRKKHPLYGDGATTTTSSSNFSDELGRAASSLRVAPGGPDVDSVSQELDYGELFVGAPIFFAPKGAGSLEFSGEADLAAAGSVLVLSNEDELLVHATTHLDFSQTLQPNFVSAQAPPNITKSQQQQRHQTVIIDPEVFAQAVTGLTKGCAAKNSVLVTHYDARRHRRAAEAIDPSEVSLAGPSTGGTGFDDRRQNSAAQLMQVNSSAGTTGIMSSPYINVVEYDHLCSGGLPTS